MQHTTHFHWPWASRSTKSKIGYPTSWRTSKIESPEIQVNFVFDISRTSPQGGGFRSRRPQTMGNNALYNRCSSDFGVEAGSQQSVSQIYTASSRTGSKVQTFTAYIRFYESNSVITKTHEKSSEAPALRAHSSIYH